MSAYNIPAEYNPVGYDDLKREFFAERPKDVDGVANASAVYYQKWILKKVFSIFDFKGLPDNWDYDYLMTTLFLEGKFCITDTDVGVIPLRCGVAGINIFNHPTEAIIANPVLGNFRRKIYPEWRSVSMGAAEYELPCALVKLQYTYLGISDMINRYAALLSMCDSAIAVNLMNSKVAFIGLAGSKAQANTMKKMYDMISAGNPAVFVRGDVVNQESFFFNHVKENFIGNDVQMLKRSIINEFLTEIGINNANQDKRERLVTDEVAANDVEIRANVEHWLYNINEGLKAANELYNMNLSCEIRKYPELQQEARMEERDESAKLD